MLPKLRRSVDLPRLRPVMRVLAVVAGALVLANLGLGLAFGVAPESLRRAEVLDPGEYQRIGEQIAAVERELSAPGRHDERPLAVVLGLSTAREDIDAAALGPRLCGGMRVLNLGSSGGSYRELAFYLETLRSAHLRSALTVLAVHPVWLAGRVQSAPPGGTDPELAAMLAAGPSAFPAKELARRWVWLYANRRGMHTLLLNTLWRVRERIARQFGLGLLERFPDGNASPWTARIAYHDPRATPAFLDEQLRAWHDYGWFDAANFSASGPEARSLRQLLVEARALGDRVVIVLLPEHSAARRRIPEAAAIAFDGALAGAVPVPLIDLRDRLPDPLFYDYAHVNSAGRARATALMGGLVSSAAGCR
jgi:hypothetical protein